MGYTTRDIEEHPLMETQSELDQAADGVRKIADRLLEMADAALSQEMALEQRGTLLAAWKVANDARTALDKLCRSTFDEIERDVGNRRGNAMDRALDEARDNADRIFAALAGGKP